MCVMFCQVCARPWNYYLKQVTERSGSVCELDASKAAGFFKVALQHDLQEKRSVANVATGRAC